MLSLSMIVKDEEKLLPHCLESVKGFVDEMVIVDTGSVDKTVEISKSYGARVEHLQWEGDFAPARNEALKLVKGDWVLVLDADEQLRPEAIEQLKQLMLEKDTLLINLLRFERGASISPYSQVSRLFRRHRNIKWTRPYHSMVDDSVQGILLKEPFWNIVNCSETALIHDGYLPEIIAKNSKALRLRIAMQKCLEKNPQDPYASAKLGALEVSEGSFERGVEILRNALDCLDKKPNNALQHYELLFNLGIALSSIDIQASKKYYQDALALPLDPKINLGAKLNLASLFVEIGNINQAIKLTLNAIETSPEVSMAWFNLGIMKRKVGNLSEAVLCYEKSLELNPLHLETYRNLALIKLLMGDIPSAREVLREAIKILALQERFEDIDMIKKDFLGIIKLEEIN